MEAESALVIRSSSESSLEVLAVATPPRKRKAADLEDAGRIRDTSAVANGSEGLPTRACPTGHSLAAFKATASGYTCDACGRGEKKGASMYGCRKCDYDMCSSCFGHQEVNPVKDTAKCPSGHRLIVFEAKLAGYKCDACNKGQQAGARMSGCRSCNYDLCFTCMSHCMSISTSCLLECPSGHRLAPVQTSLAGYKCDGCRKSQLKGARMYSCRSCDYDLCTACSETPHGTGNVKSQRQKTWTCARCRQIFRQEGHFRRHEAAASCGPGLTHCRFCGRGKSPGDPQKLKVPFPSLNHLLRHEAECSANPNKEETERELRAQSCFEDKPEFASTVQMETKDKDRRLLEILEEMDKLMFTQAEAHVQMHFPSVSMEPPKLKSDRGSERRAAYMALMHRVQKGSALPELKVELLQHQVEGLQWLLSLYHNHLGGILADEMGLGKTMQTIALIAALREFGEWGPHLVVCPKSVIGHWQKELARALPSCSQDILVYTGERELLSDLPSKKVIVIMNYEQVITKRNAVLSNHPWHLLVIDEGHRMKNHKTVFYKTVKAFKPRMKLLLTGTPLQNNLDELFNLLNYVLPGMFPCGISFKEWFAAPFHQELGMHVEVEFTEEDQQVMVESLHSMLAPFLLQRTKQEALGASLPQKKEVTLWTQLSAWQERVYEELKKSTLKRLDSGGSISSEFLNNITMQLRKIALHPFLFGRGSNIDVARASGKVEVLDRLLQKLQGQRHKVLIFSQFTSMLDILEELLELRKWPWERIDGQVQFGERQARINRFTSSEDAFVFLLSARAGGLGLNLQAADTVVLFDMDWNPQNDKQAIARAHRIGQTKEVLVVRLLAHCPIEEHMLQTTSRKLELERKLIGCGGFNRRSQTMTLEERQEQLRRMLEGSEGESLHTITTSKDANELCSRTSSEREAFDLIDRAHGVLEPDSLLLSGRLCTPAEVPNGFLEDCE